MPTSSQHRSVRDHRRTTRAVPTRLPHEPCQLHGRIKFGTARATSYRRVSTLSTTFAASPRTPAGRTGCWLTRHLRPAAMSHDLQDGWEDGHENDPHDGQREAAPDEGKVSKQVAPCNEQHHPQDGAADVVDQESPIGHPADTGHKRGECPHDGHE